MFDPSYIDACRRRVHVVLTQQIRQLFVQGGGSDKATRSSDSSIESEVRRRMELVKFNEAKTKIFLIGRGQLGPFIFDAVAPVFNGLAIHKAYEIDKNGKPIERKIKLGQWGAYVIAHRNSGYPIMHVSDIETAKALTLRLNDMADWTSQTSPAINDKAFSKVTAALANDPYADLRRL